MLLLDSRYDRRSQTHQTSWLVMPIGMVGREVHQPTVAPSAPDAGAGAKVSSEGPGLTGADRWATRQPQRCKSFQGRRESDMIYMLNEDMILSYSTTNSVWIYLWYPLIIMTLIEYVGWYTFNWVVCPLTSLSITPHQPQQTLRSCRFAIFQQGTISKHHHYMELMIMTMMIRLLIVIRIRRMMVRIILHYQQASLPKHVGIYFIIAILNHHWPSWTTIVHFHHQAQLIS